MTSSNRLDPARGLLHPLWLASLGVLVLNDHVLKGADILPAPVTGKLSDLAGMVVAPLLLATLLRVRGFRGWLGCNVAVGAVFAGIQLSAPLAEGWSMAMGVVGFPWVITRDATDLLALPMLALSLWGLLPSMQRSAAANARRSAQCGAAVIGLAASVATSYDEEPPPDDDWGSTTFEPDPEVPSDDDGWGELPPIEADYYLNNATTRDQVVRIRELRFPMSVDCEVIMESPGTLLRSSLFAPATSWTLPPGTNVPLIDHPTQDRWCFAAWIEADDLPPSIVVWRSDEVRVRDVPAQGRWGHEGEVLLSDGGHEGLHLSAQDDSVHPYEEVDPPSEGECATQPDGDRLGYSSPIPWGHSEILAVDEGVDGCLSIDLRQGSERLPSWYLCVPSSSFPFAVGDRVDLRSISAAPGELGAVDGVSVVALDEHSEPMELPSLTVSVGTAVPEIDGLELGVLPLYDCEMHSEPTCGTVERPMALVLGNDELGAAELQAGDGPQRLEGGGRTLEVNLMHAQERALVDQSCALGPDTRGLDVEVAVAQWATEG
ncbi:MAG: hypothetical protein AAF799_01750 [Myxococcota bacterium]